MKENGFVLVGNWGFHQSNKGISIFSYEHDTGELSLLETISPDIWAGQMAYDNESNIAYVVNECAYRRGEIGGGGYVSAFRFDKETGNLNLLNEKETLSCNPSYACMDKSKKYLMVCHCADPYHVTKIVKSEAGYSNEVIFDDTGVVLFKLNEDGRIDNIADVAVIQGSTGKIDVSKQRIDPESGHIQLTGVLSRVHSITMSPDGELFVLCDKGMDSIYAFKIDRKSEKMVMTDKLEVTSGDFPRYSAFHPYINVVYANNETKLSLNVIRYDTYTGSLRLLASVPLFDKEKVFIGGKPAGSVDLLVSKDGKFMYVSLSGLNLIQTLEINSEGIPRLISSAPCQGDSPRALCISPDGKHLLCGNMISGDISIFEIKESGSLAYKGKTCEAISPSVIKFV